MAGGSIGGGVASVSFTSSENLAAATKAADTILASLQSGAFTTVTYSGTGASVPSPAAGNGVAVFNVPTARPVFVGTGNPFIVVNAGGPVSIQGGAAGGTLLAGAGEPGAVLNLSYTDITPSDSATDTIIVTDGNNLVQTAATGAGNYDVATGSGNDTINILSGNSTISAGTGANQITLGSGANLINSTGFDAITGAPTGGGSDTVDITSGTASINSGSSNFLVRDSSANPLHVALGSGAVQVSLADAGAATVQGAATTTLTSGNAVVAGTQTATGDFVLLSSGASTVAAAGANDTVQALSGNNLVAAGTGNDTLLAGLGNDTLTGAVGGASSATLVSGTGQGTTFAFAPGHSGGADTITGFKPTDFLSFAGYGADPQGTAITMGNSTILTLSDGTTLTIAGATPTAHQFIIK